MASAPRTMTELPHPAAEDPRLSAAPERAPGLWLVTAFSAVVLAWGWHERQEHWLTAKSGAGYALGVVGLSLMLLLLLYSARKRVRALQGWGPVRRWFGAHMAAGILAPVAILLHANFELGSLNGRIALVCLLVVSGSGFVGRFLYTRVHADLFGRRVGLAAERPAPGPLADFEAWALAPARGLATASARLLVLGHRARRARRAALARGAAAPAVDRRIAHARRMARLALYERAFGLWHAVHLPLCALLFLAAAVHVVAVHLY